MKHYKKRNKSYESICIDRIEKGIKSIEKGHRDGDSIGKDLEFFFNKLEDINKPMYEEMYMKYCTIRMKVEKDIHS
jgi:hypothetical protein